jgi:Flp pilus assembly protein CpaB
MASLLLATLAGLLIYVSLQQAREQAQANPVEVVTPVVVAATDVAKGTVLDRSSTSTLFTLTRAPADRVASDALTSLSALEGHMTVTSLRAGDRVRASDLGALAPTTSAGPRADLLPPGHVAIVLDVNEHISVGGAVAPTDRVDLVATIPVATSADARASVPVTQAILRDVLVLATGYRTRPNTVTPSQDSSSSSEPTPPAPYSTLTLALAPQDAVLVQHLLAQNVRLALALRRPDEDAEPTSPVTTAEIARRFNLRSSAAPGGPEGSPPPGAQAGRS